MVPQKKNLKQFFDEQAIEAPRGSDFQKFIQKAAIDPSLITESSVKGRKKITQGTSLSNILIEGVFRKGSEMKRKNFKA